MFLYNLLFNRKLIILFCTLIHSLSIILCCSFVKLILLFNPDKYLPIVVIFDCFLKYFYRNCIYWICWLKECKYLRHSLVYFIFISWTNSRNYYLYCLNNSIFTSIIAQVSYLPLQLLLSSLSISSISSIIWWMTWSSGNVWCMCWWRREIVIVKRCV